VGVDVVPVEGGQELGGVIVVPQPVCADVAGLAMRVGGGGCAEPPDQLSVVTVGPQDLRFVVQRGLGAAVVIATQPTSVSSAEDVFLTQVAVDIEVGTTCSRSCSGPLRPSRPIGTSRPNPARIALNTSSVDVVRGDLVHHVAEERDVRAGPAAGAGLRVL